VNLRADGRAIAFALTIGVVAILIGMGVANALAHFGL
jgi:hypothetical protein